MTYDLKEDIPEVALAATPNNRQQLFMRYFTAVLIDLVVLNLFSDYWEHVYFESFTVSLLAAVVLQILLQATLAIEHRVGLYFKNKSGNAAKVMRVFSAWLVLFSSKFIILYALNFLFGDSVMFTGPLHGVVAFIAVVVVILAAEELVARTYRALA